ncbi:coagulation factor X-like [Mustelus asterias]
MTIILSYGIISLFLFGCQANDLFLQKPDAARFLSRFRRANYLFEEAKGGNLERECLEETCSREEVREIFEDDTNTDLFWAFYAGTSDCDLSPCENGGICLDIYGDIFCNCPGGFNGTFCEFDINECELLNVCPPGTTCVDGINNFTCNCPVDGCKGLTLRDN